MIDYKKVLSKANDIMYKRHHTFLCSRQIHALAEAICEEINNNEKEVYQKANTINSTKGDTIVSNGPIDKTTMD